MVKKELPLPLQAENVSTPQILNTWSTAEGGVAFHRVQLFHNDLAADPQSKCSGLVSITFRPGDRGDKTATCQSCQKLVPVSLSFVKAELRLPL